MCGVAGVLGETRGFSASEVAQRMSGALHHRGPDSSGVWSDPARHLALGHTRLAILDLSPAGHQPMKSPDGRLVLSFNGEIYNHLELRAQLPHSGSRRWRGTSDTETLLACFQEWGIERTLRATKGMFALALWDARDATVTLARDRMGEKPLYIAVDEERVLFASELSALRRAPGFRAEVDRRSLALLLKHNYIPAPHSIFRGTSKLIPGTYVRLQLGRSFTLADLQSAQQPYWRLQDELDQGARHPLQGSTREVVGALQGVLEQAVQRQMLSDVPLGALMSGGLDSTLIVALMQQARRDPVRTFTIGFSESSFDESRRAREIATHLKTSHTELRLTGRDALDLVPDLAQLYSEPLADASQLPTCLVMRLARAHVSVALSGDGGDELFGGYKRYRIVPELWSVMRRVPQPLRPPLGKLLERLSDPGGAVAGAARKRAPTAGLPARVHRLALRLQSSSDVLDLYASFRSEWLELDESTPAGAPHDWLLTDRPSWPRAPSAVERMMALDALTYLPDDILAKVDRAAMAVSLETRAPFLDPDVVRLSTRIPLEHKIRRGQTKWILRELLRQFVPDSLTSGPKMGFGIPVDDWLRGPLRDWADDLLSPKQMENDGWFDQPVIQRSWHRHLDGRENNGHRLWSVLMFQSWWRHHSNL